MPTNTTSASRILFSTLAIAVILTALNMYMLVIASDFWTSPGKIENKLGIAAYEALLTILFFLAVSTPALLVEKRYRSRIANYFLATTMLAVCCTLLVSWSLYNIFEKFLGTFAIQMFMHDGAQIIEYMGRMPSTVDLTLMAPIAVCIAFCLWLSIGNSTIQTRFTRTLSIIAILMIPAAGALSLTLNRPSKSQEGNSNGLTHVLQRVRSAEFSMLTAKGGPFSFIASQAISSIASPYNKKRLDIATLRSREHEVPPSTPKTEGMKNIVVVVVESLQPAMLQAYGGEPAVMPNVNELSQSGYLLANTWAQASHSNYADIAIYSGQYPLRSENIHFYPKKPDYPKALPYEHLEKFGYKSGVFSSGNENWGLMKNYLESTALDIFSYVGSENIKKGKSYDNVEERTLEDGSTQLDFSNFMYKENSNGIGRLDSATTQAAIDWLNSFNHETPFYASFAYQASHFPFDALPENYKRKFLVEKNEKASRVRSGNTANAPIEYVLKSYMDSLHYVDHNIGKLVDYLKETGRHENTIYLITADTSILIGSKLLGNGGELIDDVLHVPAIISVPESRETTTISYPVEQIDLLPTVLTLAGAGPHPASQGVDILTTKSREKTVYAVAQTPAAHQYSAIHNGLQVVFDYDMNRKLASYIDQEGTSEAGREIDPQEIEWLAKKLQSWINGQLEYYSQPSLQAKYYPPQFDINTSSVNEPTPITVTSDKD